MKNSSKFFFFVLTSLCVAFCVLISHFFAGIISTNTFGAANISASVSEICLYGVCGKSFGIKSQATEFANSLKAKNSGSYIYNKDDKFYVICSIYEHENDAKNVLENILESYPNCEIIKIKIDGLEFANLTNQNFKKSLTSSFASLKQAYLDLYDISVCLDTSVYSQAKAVIECSKIQDCLKNISLPSGNSATEGAFSVLVKNKIKKINESIEELINFNASETYTFSSKIKDTYINLVFEWQDLVNNLNEK